jgi:hypothetical protein
VVVCVKYKRKKAETKKPTAKEPSEKPLPCLVPEPGVKYVGIDPGRKMFIGAVALVGSEYKNIKIYTNTYRHENGTFTRKKKLQRWTGVLENQIEVSRLSAGSPYPEQKSTQYGSRSRC